MNKHTVDISTGIIFRTILILLAIWFLYLIKDIIAILFIAVIFTSSIEPVVNWLARFRFPRSLSVLIVYFVLFGILGTMIYFIIPPFVSQVQSFSNDFPGYMERIMGIFRGLETYAQAHNLSFNPQQFFQGLGGNLSQTSNKIFSTTVGVFSGFISVIVILSLTFYMSVKKDGMKGAIMSVIPENYHDHSSYLIDKIKIQIGRWMQGQFLLMLFIFILYYLALYFLDVPYALLLAIFGGVMEIIPYLGPIISGVPAVILGFLISPLTGFLVLGAYVLIQQIENHIITPQVMKKAIGLNPVIIILVLLVGAQMGGVLGAILAVPIATVASVFIKDFFGKKKESEN
jgi:predicted PurR-regulated permease PerM